jgi:hypothetical protein
MDLGRTDACLVISTCQNNLECVTNGAQTRQCAVPHTDSCANRRHVHTCTLQQQQSTPWNVALETDVIVQVTQSAGTAVDSTPHD